MTDDENIEDTYLRRIRTRWRSCVS